MAGAILAFLGALLAGSAFMKFANVLHMPLLNLFAAGFLLTIGLYLAFVAETKLRK